MKKNKKKFGIIYALLIVVVISAGGYYVFNKTQNKNKPDLTKTIPPPKAEKNSSVQNFIIYSRDSLIEDGKKLTSDINQVLNSSMEARHFSSETLRDFVSLTECETKGNTFQFGLIDPFIFGCFQQKQENLEILYTQQGCSIHTFIIANKDKGVERVEDLNGKNLTVLGQSRAIVLAKHRFPKEGAIEFKDVYLSNNPDRTLRKDLPKEFVDAVFVVGFKRDGVFSIPLIKADTPEAFNSTYPDFKIIEAKDYEMPCSLIAVEKTYASSLTPEMKTKLMEKINNNASLASLTGTPEKLQMGGFKSIDQEMIVTRKAIKGDIRALSVQYRKTNKDKSNKAPEDEGPP